ncbi:MAG: helix-turn-helix domain-containing protein [Bacteroidota bacterium]
MEKLQYYQFKAVGYQNEIGFELLEMEDIFSLHPSEKKDPFKPHRINFFAVLLLAEGEMTHQVDFVDYRMMSGDCLFISKGQIHKFDPSGTYKGYGLIFTEKFMLHHISPSAYSKISFLYNHYSNPSPFKDAGDRDLIVGSLKKELSSDLGKIKADVVAALLTVLLLKAQLNPSNSLAYNEKSYPQFIKFQNLVALKFMHTRTVGHYAALLDMTHKQLNKLCTCFTGKTAKDYISNYIALEAKRQLATTNVQVKQIAFACGYKEVTNFLKFFKKMTGSTPMEFRQKVN